MLGCIQTNPLFEIIGIWLLSSGIIGFLAMGIDKAKAMEGAWRIPEKALIVIALAGGALGMAMGSALFHHKTSKLSFLAVFMPIVAVYLVGLQQTGLLSCLSTYLPR